MSLYIVEWEVDGQFANQYVLRTNLKSARHTARTETEENETVRIYRVTGLHPVPISPRKEMNQSDVLSQSEPC